jgi:hypothetical protein
MATFDFTVTEANIGQVIGPADGFLVNLTMTTPPVHEVPRWNEGSQKWVSGYFVLRGSSDIRDFYCSQTRFTSNVLVRDHSLGYRGDLVVVNVPARVFGRWDVPRDDCDQPAGRNRTARRSGASRSRGGASKRGLARIHAAPAAD